MKTNKQTTICHILESGCNGISGQGCIYIFVSGVGAISAILRNFLGENYLHCSGLKYVFALGPGKKRFDSTCMTASPMSQLSVSFCL